MLYLFLKKDVNRYIGNIRKHLGEVLHELARQKDVVIEEGHLMRDHVHMCLSIPPKYSVSTVVGFERKKCTIYS